MNLSSKNSFETLSTMNVGGRKYRYYDLNVLSEKGFDLSQIPFSLKVFLENLLRFEDGKTVKSSDIEALASWMKKSPVSREVFFMPSRVLMQDFTGVPALVDLAAMRDAVKARGGNPKMINPLIPVDLVIDHSVQVDFFGSADALLKNSELEFHRNKERYAFLKWGQKAFRDFRAVPPETGICHQVNLEYLAKVVWTRENEDGELFAYPDTLVGTDSHTTMINGIGVLGWGVGGIEAEAAMLGQSLSMLIPEVVGFKLTGKLSAGATATDAVLTVTEALRKKGVVGKFVEFYGPGLSDLPVADRATLANMAPEYGATAGFFPVDEQTLKYLRLMGRKEDEIALVEAYCRKQGLFRTDQSPEPHFSSVLSLDLGTVESCLAGPKRPQDRVLLSRIKSSWNTALESLSQEKDKKGNLPAPLGTSAEVVVNGKAVKITHGAVVIAAITSCTNTSNPAVLIGAGLLAKKAVEKGLTTKPWVKTSLAPGSKAVAEYLRASGLSGYLDGLGFQLVGYGCTTCIGNSGPLPEPIAKAVLEKNLIVAAVLSGNRNFEGRVNPLVKANYLASPLLVVAYALAGTIDADLKNEPIGVGKNGSPVYLKDIWPSHEEISALIEAHVRRELFTKTYADVFTGTKRWREIPVVESDLYQWDEDSTYIRLAPYFEKRGLKDVSDISEARVLAVFGDSITTDHISPAGSFPKDSPAGAYLEERGVGLEDFNSYGSRRGNHEIMMRGTFANTRIRNLALDSSGGYTLIFPEKKQASIFDAAMQYHKRKTPLVVLAGKEYGSGSSRDWAAKGPALLGVCAVIAQSFERIHRSNLVGMGILPLEFTGGQSVGALGLSGHETIDIKGLASLQPRRELSVRARSPEGKETEFKVLVRIDTAVELEYWKHGGILPYMLEQILGQDQKRSVGV